MDAERVIPALVENRAMLFIVVMFAAMALWEFLAPTRRPVESITSRWSRNFALSVASAVMTGRWLSLWLVGGFAYLAHIAGNAQKF